MNKLNVEIVPAKVLRDGAKIPVIGLGTFGSDNYSNEEIAGAVRTAICKGYRHIDFASVYGNEKEIGEVLAELFGKGEVKREELWITSKVCNNMHGAGDVIRSCRQSLTDLKLEYLDLYLVHWPFPNYHAPGCDGDSRNPGSKPYIHESYMVVWRQMEQLVDLGLVKSIGTSNMTIPKMELLLRDDRIKPVVNQMEIHPHFQQPELFRFMIDNQVQPIGFSPIGSPKRPERDRTTSDSVDIEDPVIVSIALRLNLHPAVVCLKWAVQCGQVTIPFSVNPNKLFSNLEAVTKDPLLAEEMDEISKIDKNNRLIKGQVFLWKGAKGWEELWDLDGLIAR